MKEKDLQKKMKSRLSDMFGGTWAKTHGSGFQITFLDLMACIPPRGTHVEIEVKMPGREKTLSDRQKKRIRDVRESGGIAFMSSSVEHAVETLLEEINVRD